MRHIVRLALVLAWLTAPPLRADAQVNEDAGASRLERWHPEAFTDPREPALQLTLDSSAVQVTPSAPPTVDELALEEIDKRISRARIGIGASVAAFGVGAVIVPTAYANSICFTFGEASCPSDRRIWGLVGFGSAMMAAGLAGAIASGVALAKRKREREHFKDASYRKPARVRWDPERSQFTF